MNLINTITGFSRKSLCIAALVLALAAGSAAQAQAQQPNLYMVSAGVSQYTDMQPLKCAHKDALDMAAMFKAQQGKQFGQVQVQTLTDNQATAANIDSAINAAKAQATADSVLIVYLAGHGGKGPNQAEYGYCAFDKNINWSHLQRSLRGVPGKVIVILDTCQAGTVTGDSNILVICGSMAHQSGGEDMDVNGNGWFTKSLIEALRGRADANGDGTITLSEMETYVASRVSQISGGMQNMQMLWPAAQIGGMGLVQVAPVATTTTPQGIVPVSHPNSNSSLPSWATGN